MHHLAKACFAPVSRNSIQAKVIDRQVAFKIRDYEKNNLQSMFN